MLFSAAGVEPDDEGEKEDRKANRWEGDRQEEADTHDDCEGHQMASSRGGGTVYRYHHHYTIMTKVSQDGGSRWPSSMGRRKPSCCRLHRENGGAVRDDEGGRPELARGIQAPRQPSRRRGCPLWMPARWYAVIVVDPRTHACVLLDESG